MAHVWVLHDNGTLQVELFRADAIEQPCSDDK